MVPVYAPAKSANFVSMTLTVNARLFASKTAKVDGIEMPCCHRPCPRSCAPGIAKDRPSARCSRGYFSARTPSIPSRQLNRVFHQAREDAAIDKKVSLHSLRHAFATHLLEQHYDIRVIQVLLGHKKITNTMRYSQVATNLLKEVKGPLESLDR